MPQANPSHSGILLSIQLNSNQPEQIVTFLDAIQKTARRPERVEVLINIDTGDESMMRVLDEQKATRPMQIKYIESDLPGGFFDLWKPLNTLITLTDPSAYFVMNVSDEFMFVTHHWDDLIERYVGYYPDHIFRLRASQFRFRNYKDFWECGYAPDSLALYSKRWFDVTGDWNPCFGPDSFQQCVAFYLYSYLGMFQHQLYRDIPEPFLEFKGEGVSHGLTPEQKRKRNKGHIKHWFILMSHEMQQEANRRACLLRADIIAQQQKIQRYELRDDVERKRIQIIDLDKGYDVENFSYKLNYWRITLTNQLRKLAFGYYVGGCYPSHRFSIFSIMNYFINKDDWPLKLGRLLLRNEENWHRVRNMTPLSPIRYVKRRLAQVLR